jgi:glycolate oxidase iron-sulfur subunit
MSRELTLDIEAELRRCVHCGFCTSACPTYAIEGNELDGPRGRITLIEAMLHEETAPAPEVVLHIDRCLSCLACTSACPSGVQYGTLIDAARAHIETHYKRPLPDRLLRGVLGQVLPNARAFGIALALGRMAKPLSSVLPAPLRAMIDLLPASAAGMPVEPGFYSAAGETKMTVGLLLGCVQDPLSPAINHAAIRVLTALGAAVVVPTESVCCGALSHHLGDEPRARSHARATLAAVDAMTALGAGPIITTASGCGTLMKNYGALVKDDPAFVGLSTRIRDICQIVAELGWPETRKAEKPLRLAYQSACSLQHGQKIDAGPKALLTAAGFAVLDLPEAHLCCGSAGTYNLLEPGLSGALRARKQAAIDSTGADAVASGNIGCIMQLTPGSTRPISNFVEWLDYALGGAMPGS